MKTKYGDLPAQLAGAQRNNRCYRLYRTIPVVFFFKSPRPNTEAMDGGSGGSCTELFHHCVVMFFISTFFENMAKSFLENSIIKFLIIKDILSKRMRFSIYITTKCLIFIILQHWFLKNIVKISFLNEIKKIFDYISHAISNKRRRLVLISNNIPVRMIIILNLFVFH